MGRLVAPASQFRTERGVVASSAPHRLYPVKIDGVWGWTDVPPVPEFGGGGSWFGGAWSGSGWYGSWFGGGSGGGGAPLNTGAVVTRAGLTYVDESFTGPTEGGAGTWFGSAWMGGSWFGSSWSGAGAGVSAVEHTVLEVAEKVLVI